MEQFWEAFTTYVYLMAQQHKCTSGTVLLMAEGVDDFFVAALLLCDLQFNTYIHTYIHTPQVGRSHSSRKHFG